MSSKTKQSWRSAGLSAAAIAFVGPVAAAEYCVTCAGPAAMYACAIEGAPRDAPVDPRMQLLCIQELARSGAHESCSVPRSAPKPCPGTVRMVAAPSLAQPAATQPPPSAEGLPRESLPTQSEQAQSGPVQSEQVTSPGEAGENVAAGNDQASSKPPRTVKEMATRTLQASKDGLEKAGEAVAGTAEKTGETVEKAGGAVSTAAKKTWHCLTSLFSEC